MSARTSAFEARTVMARGSASFTLASRIFPTDVRDDVAVLYAWCRRVDDAVEETPPGWQHAHIVMLRRELTAIYSDRVLGEPIASDFQEMVARRGVPRRYADELLEGMAMDASNTAYGTVEDLLVYCYRAAGTVGHMMCHVMGLRDGAEHAAAMQSAADLGIAMQLTNVCRDVAEDWSHGRLYLPEVMLAQAGAPDLRSRLNAPFPSEACDAVGRVVRQLLARADAYYASGDAGLSALSPRCALAVRAARLVYSEIGRELARVNCDPLAGRATVPGATKARLMIRAVLETARDAPSWR